MTTTGDRKELHWLMDMQEAINKIEKHPQYARGRQAFEQDEFFQVWIFYYMQRIGECASHLRWDYDYDSKYPEIEYLPKIKEKLAILIRERKE